MKKQLAFLLSLCLLVLSAQAQISILCTKNIDSLVNKVLLGKNTGITIENVQYSGYRNALGMFKWKLDYNHIIPKGLILSTGNVNNAIGPNNQKGASSNSTNYAVDEDLKPLCKSKIFDGAILEFDFISPVDSISFNYFFASEEYPEYVNKGVNDVFAFFLKDLSNGKQINLALLQPDNVPVSVDNINGLRHNAYFIPNAMAEEGNFSAFADNKAMGELAYDLQYDGLTTLLHAGAKVVPHRRYHLKLSIADVGDSQFDSAIFLEAESFRTVVPEAPKAPQQSSLEKGIRSNFEGNSIKLSDSTISVDMNIGFAFNESAITGTDSYALLDKMVAMLKRFPKLTLRIEGHTDKVGTPAYNYELSLKRAKEVGAYLEKQGILAERIQTMGFGATKPVSTTNQDANRRVSFVFKKP